MNQFVCFLFQKSTFHGISLWEGKRVSSTVEFKKNGGNRATRGLQINAKTAGASKSIEVEVDKPLGLTLGQKPGGGVVITVSFRLNREFSKLIYLLNVYVILD